MQLLDACLASSSCMRAFAEISDWTMRSVACWLNSVKFGLLARFCLATRTNYTQNTTSRAPKSRGCSLEVSWHSAGMQALIPYTRATQYAEHAHQLPNMLINCLYLSSTDESLCTAIAAALCGAGFAEPVLVDTAAAFASPNPGVSATG